MKFYSKLYRKKQLGWKILLRFLGTSFGIVTFNIFTKDTGTKL